MILRERQKLFVERSLEKLRERGNTLGVAPTGSGKTIMLAAVVGRSMDANGSKACVLAHRDEITSQNVDKFLKVNPGMSVSVVDATQKTWTGKTIFAMVQTLSRRRNLESMPPLDLLVIDEAHHAHAATYRRIIDAARVLNPKLKLFGVTATPNRGDGKGLRDIFDNCADQITLGEMIASGQLVRPRTFVIDLGVQEELGQVRRLADDYDMNEVAAIMDHSPLTEAVVKHWREKAGDRRTVVFCSTIAHARHVAEEFETAGVSTAMVTGETPDENRRNIFRRLEDGSLQVLVNVAVATEGWDCPPISCVVLLRPCSHKSTMVQMIGRGLRKIDPVIYPGIVKTDCIVLDFGTSSLIHGSLEQEVELDGEEKDAKGQAPMKTCPECESEVPIRVRECPVCGHEFPQLARPELSDFTMREIDLLKRSPFQWCDVDGNGARLVATGFDAWGGVFQSADKFIALGGLKDGSTRLLGVGDKTTCLASADDWLNMNETEEAAHKSRRWLKLPPSDKQLFYLPQEQAHLPSLTRYMAACLLTLRFNRGRIQRALAEADRRVA
jgi:DNA repair protein RadD